MKTEQPQFWFQAVPGGHRIVCRDPADRPLVRKALRLLDKRLRTPIVTALSDKRCPLAREYIVVGIEHYLFNLSPSKIAEQHRLSVAEVRRMLAFIHGWQKGAGK